MVATSVGGEAIQTSKALVGVVQAAKKAGVKSVVVCFSGLAKNTTNAAAEPQEGTDVQNGASKRQAEVSENAVVKVDLSQPLGIGFDDDLAAKDVQVGSQAEKLGICSGWRVCAVGGEEVKTTKELVG